MLHYLSLHSLCILSGALYRIDMHGPIRCILDSLHFAHFDALRYELHYRLVAFFGGIAL